VRQLTFLSPFDFVVRQSVIILLANIRSNRRLIFSLVHTTDQSRSTETELASSHQSFVLVFANELSFPCGLLGWCLDSCWLPVLSQNLSTFRSFLNLEALLLYGFSVGSSRYHGMLSWLAWCVFRQLAATTNGCRENRKNMKGLATVHICRVRLKYAIYFAFLRL